MPNRIFLKRGGLALRAEAMGLAPIYLRDWLKAVAVALFSTFWVEAFLQWRNRKKKT